MYRAARDSLVSPLGRAINDQIFKLPDTIADVFSQDSPYEAINSLLSGAWETLRDLGSGSTLSLKASGIVVYLNPEKKTAL